MPNRTGNCVMAALGLWLAAAATPGLAQQPRCGDLANAFGPYDYNDPENRKLFGGGGDSHLSIVERAHLTAFEALTRTDFDTMGSIDYTLRAFPNHPRALFLLIRFDRKMNGKLPIPPRNADGTSWPGTVDCYFERAMRFAPKDPIVRQLLGVYLHWNGRYEEALAAYAQATELGLKSAELYYNIGLAHYELKQYPEAKNYAHKAYDLGYPTAGLRNKLTSIGQWP